MDGLMEAGTRRPPAMPRWMSMLGKPPWLTITARTMLSSRWKSSM